MPACERELGGVKSVKKLLQKVQKQLSFSGIYVKYLEKNSKYI